MKKFCFFVIIALAVMIITSAWADPEISPGKWEITSQTKMAGMPTQSVTSVQCITLGDPIPMQAAGSQECQIRDRKINGNAISWKISCQGQGGGMSGTGNITYNGNTMKGTMRMTVEGANIEVVNTLSGRRIGDCYE